MKVSKQKLKKIIRESLETAVPEKERIVDQIIAKLRATGVVSKNNKTRGLIDMVDNYDEFEDLMRFIVDATGLPNDNNQVYNVLKRIAEDFREDPNTAADLSVFNIG